MVTQTLDKHSESVMEQWFSAYFWGSRGSYNKSPLWARTPWVWGPKGRSFHSQQPDEELSD